MVNHPNRKPKSKPTVVEQAAGTPAAEAEPTIESYKGFTADLGTLYGASGWKYEIGKSYEHDGEVYACQSGFHACPVEHHPLSVFEFYGPAGGNRFARVTQSGRTHSDDKTKLASARIIIDAEIFMPDLVKRAAEWVQKAVKIALGNRAHAATTGEGAHAATTGEGAHAATTGEGAHAATTGNRAHAATTGEGAHAATTGEGAHAATTGEGAHAATTGNRAHAATTGEGAHAATTGYRAHAATTGEGAHAATTGYRAHAATTGNRAHAATTGEGAHAATTGEGAIAAGLGINSTGKCGPDGWLVLAAYDGNYKLVNVRAAKCGTEGIEAGKPYRLTEAGQFEEVTYPPI